RAPETIPRPKPGHDPLRKQLIVAGLLAFQTIDRTLSCWSRRSFFDATSVHSGRGARRSANQVHPQPSRRIERRHRLDGEPLELEVAQGDVHRLPLKLGTEDSEDE